ncbi:CsgG/HfaB family protein [Pelagicoccus sp. SDUM812002]|uniref:CsgG/HfaB family protein n=1 Tax=Pelagicoccus sp. SDUM812002 TaxID=3041266 RepID=UPI00280D0A84|nr:CsgG/HfaB family protein [Pelagicoccus sp. SDUM812002]MDQ8186723.1 CsgG/HfaB family protein [Pelagicoccus sp. SDUM812002]
MRLPTWMFGVIACSFALPSIADDPRIAVVDFSSESTTGLSYGLPDQIAEDLVNTGKYEVYERSKLNTLLQEQDFQESGFANPDSAIAFGKLSGVDYIITGQIADFGQETRNFSGYGVSSRTTFYRLKAGLKVVDATTGRIVFSRSATAEESVVEGRSSRVSDSTVDVRLVEILSAELVAALQEKDPFKSKRKDGLVSLEVLSEPANADVEVDGVFYGNAGSAFEVSEGLHTIKVSLPGFEVWEKKVMVREGMTFKATLSRKVDARIEVDVDKS